MTDAFNPGYTVILMLMAFLAASVWLGTLAQRAVDNKKFLEGFFLGNRGLGAWTLALTATVQSGGTFMGVPSLVYSTGWVVALWISAYMVVPLMGFAMIGKRLAQLSRKTGSITVPDIFRSRFDDERVGLCASLLIIFFLSFTMFAQFKAGATIMKLAWPGTGIMSFSEEIQTPEELRALESQATDSTKKPPREPPDYKYLTGLAIFAITVVGYTMIGGFLASVWTDLFQSILMVIGVMLLVCLAVPAAGGMEAATLKAMEATSPAYALGPGHNAAGRHFLSPGLAISMFFMWVYSGFASPASMIRVMAAQNTEVMRKSICLLSCYNCFIYIPIIMIAICGQALLPNLEKPDEVVPRLAMGLTANLPGGSLLASLILAAPFGAIMASVSCFVLVIASGLVQDLYLRFWSPKASQREIRIVTRLSMLLVGIVGVAAVISPPKYLQVLIVFSGSAGAASFVTPVLMTCYSRRATAAGMLSAMLGGFGVYLSLYVAGWTQTWALTSGTTSSLAQTVIAVLGPDQMIGADSAFRPYFLLGLDPVLWGMAASAVAGIVVSRWTRPPSPEHISRLFDAPLVHPSMQGK